MKPLSELDRANLIGVLTDIDDTLTTDGRLLPDAYDALWRLHRAGLIVIPITGRSAGWAHMVLKTWPVPAVVAESGGVYLARGGGPIDSANNAACEHPGGARLRIEMHASAAQVRADRAALEACGQAILQKFPGLAPASDNPFRLVDYALDYCEEVARVSPNQVDAAIAMFRDQGFCARASSVHINAWRGGFDKAPMALRLLNDLFHDSAGRHQPQRWVFVGDAPNDASMFASFPVSVGVANIRTALDQLSAKPAYLTNRSFGAGFVELADHLLQGRETR